MIPTPHAGGRRLLCLGLTAALLSLACPAAAHDAGEARLDVRVDGETVAIDLTLARVDALDLIGLEPAEAPPDASLLPALRVAMPQWLVLEAPAPCPWSAVKVEPSGLKGLQVTARATCAGATALDWRAARHPRIALRAVGTLHRGAEPAAFTLGKLDPPLRLAEVPGLGAFVLSGVEHILIGWDHLAFLLAILLGCSTLRRVLAVVTAFTVAHSITLALGATGVLVLPSGPVEAVIALSIAIAAALGLQRLRAGTLDHPGREPAVAGGLWPALAVCFGFGLVHGLGFAGLLVEMLPRDAGRLGPLLGFNLGVELGQVAVVGLLFPLLAALGRRPTGRRVIGALLAGLAALGTLVTLLRILG